MLTLTIEHASIQSFICPHCLEEISIYSRSDSQLNCYFCNHAIWEGTRVVLEGVIGRFAYYNTGWPKMDVLARERTAELRNQKT